MRHPVYNGVFNSSVCEDDSEQLDENDVENRPWCNVGWTCYPGIWFQNYRKPRRIRNGQSTCRNFNTAGFSTPNKRASFPCDCSVQYAAASRFYTLETVVGNILKFSNVKQIQTNKVLKVDLYYL